MPRVRTDLPEFTAPPVVEVACSIQFQPIKAFSTVHPGDFWNRIKKEYPRTEDHPPIAEMFEGKPGIEIPDSLDLPPLRRVFYIEETNNFLLQLQQSRFLGNWRKVDPKEPYPRFSAAYAKFVRGWRLFLDFLKDARLAAPEVNQYELTYINHIVEADAALPAGIEKFLPMMAVSSARSTRYLGDPNAVGMRLRFPLPKDKGNLHVKIELGRRNLDAKPLVLLDLTARGPAMADCSDMEEWFESAHEAIVCGFTDLTSPAAHSFWGRTR